MKIHFILILVRQWKRWLYKSYISDYHQKTFPKKTTKLHFYFNRTEINDRIHVTSKVQVETLAMGQSQTCQGHHYKPEQLYLTFPADHFRCYCHKHQSCQKVSPLKHLYCWRVHFEWLHNQTENQNKYSIMGKKHKKNIPSPSSPAASI